MVLIGTFISMDNLMLMKEKYQSEFLNELNRGGLSIPTLNTVFLIHCATSAHEVQHPGNYNETALYTLKYFYHILMHLFPKMEMALPNSNQRGYKAYVIK